MATILWPLQLLAPQTVSIDLAARTLSAPPSVSGFTQVVASDAGLWKVTFDKIPVHGIARVKAWRAIANLLEGRLNPILVPITNKFQPVPVGSESLYDAVPHSDDSFFSDGTGYVGRVIDVETEGSWATRAVSGFAQVNYAAEIEPGQHFSVGDGRLYRVRTFTPDTSAITWRPPLRESVSSGEHLEFDYPVVRCRLASDSEMDLPLDYNEWSFPTVNFIEDL